MQDLSDAQLLSAYAERGAEAAFAELVTRHTDLVYSAALRQVYSSDLARDVAQSVFTDLARKAREVSSKLSLNVSLVGWLYRGTRFAARDLNRTEIRRTQRERQAMEHVHPTPESAPDWDQLHPALDDAMAELDDADRDALLLRYFKNCDLRTVGATLGISDDAAQKRVSRAVERLREFFAKRGVTVGASGLAIVISANAVQAAPVGLALTISTATALTGTSLATTATITATKVIAMTTLQKTIVTAIIAVLAGVGIYENREGAQLRRQVQTLQQQESALTERIQQLEAANIQPPQVANENPVPRGSSNEQLRLRGEVARLRRENEESKVPVTYEAVSTRYKNAQELARNGDAAGALKEYLWCYDVGMRQVPSFGGVRSSYLLNAIAKLGESYPEALAALRERRDQALQRILTSENDPGAALDYAALNRALKEEQDLLATIDQLPPDDNRRKALAEVAYDQLLTAQRYEDALSGRSYEKISMFFDMGKMDIPMPTNTPGIEKIQQSRRDNLVKTTVKDVEMLAGAGDLAHAKTLAERLLDYDNSPETIALLNQHLTRAGQAGLLGAAANR